MGDGGTCGRWHLLGDQGDIRKVLPSGRPLEGSSHGIHGRLSHGDCYGGLFLAWLFLSMDRLRCDHFCQQWLPSPAMGLLQHSADRGTIPLTLQTKQFQSFLSIE